MSKVVVLGSINIDMVMEAERFPRIGETILGGSIDYYMGGKGANQAVACSRVDGEVLLYGCVGDDTFGEKAINHLKEENVNTNYITVEKNIFTGTASIFRIGTDNAIVVLPGANMLLKQVEPLTKLLGKDDIFLTQLEIPILTIAEGLAIAKERGATTILNPAPFTKDFLPYLELVDIVTPNETEFEGMVGYPIADETFEEEMLKWSAQHKTQLIVTRGAVGVSYVKEDKVVTIPTKSVEVVDTTGAGDTFNGILAALLSTKVAIHEAISLASIGATLSTTKPGAQTGMPKKPDIEAFLVPIESNCQSLSD